MALLVLGKHAVFFSNRFDHFMIAIGILGLLLPGYVMARRCAAPFSWAVAFPLSALAIVETVIVLSLCHVAICIWTVAAALAIITVIALAIARFAARFATAEPAEQMTRREKSLLALVAVHASFVVLALAVRCSLYPLSGADTIYRWDAFARMLLAEGSLVHYPPLTDDDFAHYVYPDAIPPLVSSVYWWLYAAWGAAEPAITTVAMALQALSCFSLVYFAARTAFGNAGGIISLVAISSSPLFIGSLAIGQESGYLAISYAGQLAFALAALKKPEPRYAILAGLFAAAGARARLWTAIFLVWIIRARHRSRQPPVAANLLRCPGAGRGPLVRGRTWLLTGNPLYPNDPLHLGLPTNAVHVGLHEMYSEIVGPRRMACGHVDQFFTRIIFGAPLAIVLAQPDYRSAGARPRCWLARWPWLSFSGFGRSASRWADCCKPRVCGRPSTSRYRWRPGPADRRSCGFTNDDHFDFAWRSLARRCYARQLRKSPCGPLCWPRRRFAKRC